MPDTNGPDAGGRRGPSIRRPLYFLVAVPLLTVIGLYAFILYTTVGDAINLDRAPNLINATSIPAAKFDLNIQNERKASLVYLAAPTHVNRAQLEAAQAATTRAFPAFQAEMTGPATASAATTTETAVIKQMLDSIQGLSAIRPQILAGAISPTQVFDAFSNILAEQMKLFIVENASLTNATAATQSLAAINSTESGEFLLQEDALVSAALAAHRLTPATRIQVTQLAGARQAMLRAATSRFDAPDLATFNAQMNRYAPPAVQSDLAQLENAIAADPTGSFPPIKAAEWNPVVQREASGLFFGGVTAARQQVQHDSTITNTAWRRVALAGGVGLLGLVLSVLLSVLIGRWIIRRLGRLEESATALAEVELPSVVARLRPGEDVPVEELSGTTADLGRDEIGRVGRAFDAARRTAIEAAVGEARMRRGINDVFRNLARRNQSLLHRQLTVLDGMERRTTDPETLEDLFRLDHLTTRMRRHSEGLIILSGAAPGRGWVHPVRMIDVLRAAAAEVEDYSRVSVTTPSQAALTGPAVADVIHLLAELIENATTLSPPYTPVRVSGDLVASGFAVEIEDRGLGMSEQRYVELNGRLAEPPEFDVFNSEQLGLFVVGQLAKRHGIRVTLRPSPYGGTTAIALIPATLVGVEEGFAEGLPTGMTAISSAWAAGRNEMPASDTTVQPSSSRAELTGQSWSALPQGNGSFGPAKRDAPVAGGAGSAWFFTAGPSFGAGPHADQPSPGLSSGGLSSGGLSSGGLSSGGPANGGSSGGPSNGPGVPYGEQPYGEQPYGEQPYGEQPYGEQPYGEQPYGEQPYGTDPYTGQAYGWTSPPSGSSFGRPAGTSPAPTETGQPWPYDRPPPSGNGMGQPPMTRFPASDPAEPPASTYRPYTQDETAFSPPGDPFPAPQAPLPPAEPASPPAQPSNSEAEPAMPPGVSHPSTETALPPAGSFPSENGAEAQQDEMHKGLPKRVRQASLAPQLRDRTTPRSAPSAASGENVVNRSPDDIRNALSAMQRGWQKGRAANEGGSPEQDGAPENGAHAAGGSHAGGPDDAAVPGDEQLVANEERATAQGRGSDNDSAGGSGYDGGFGSGADDGTAGSHGAGSVGYPDYPARLEPAGDTAHDTEAEASSHDEQGYRGGNDDI